MNHDNIVTAIDSEALARDTLDFIRVKSETGQEGDGSRFLADLLHREGLEVTVDEVEPGRPNIYARVPGRDRGRPALLFNGHTDTIPIGSSAAPARDGDWIIGRGAEDMKGGLVAMVHAAAALRKSGARLAGDLWLTGVIDHETPVGQKAGPRRLIEQLRSGAINADAIVIVEGPCAVWSASLGSAIFTITMRSHHGPIHTIKVPYADNPARWLGKLLLDFERLEEGFAVGAAHPLCGREQLNVGIVQAGDYPNRLPTPITVVGTRRWPPGKTAAHVKAELEGVCARLAAESNLEFSVSLQAEREPFETPRAHPLIGALCQAAQKVTGRAPTVIGMGLVGDANLYANAGGVPTVYYGPAHETAHSDLERVSVAQLAHCAKVYALAAAAFCGTV